MNQTTAIAFNFLEKSTQMCLQLIS